MSTAPTSRSLQAKIDEWVSVLDYGAKGDGVTDDTSAINRAFEDLFCEQINTEIRRGLRFPAGRYRVSGAIKIPSYSVVMGEGINSSLIVLEASAAESYVATTADNLLQVDSELGNNGAQLPRNIYIRDIAFISQNAAAAFRVNTCKNIGFENVQFRGALTLPTAAGSNIAFDVVNSVVNQVSENIQLSHCEIAGGNHGMHLDANVKNITVTETDFHDCYTGVTVKPSASGNGTEVLRITHSYFDKIYASAINVTEGAGKVLSAFNVYYDVGTEYTATTVQYRTLDFDSANCASLFDFFKYTSPLVATVDFHDKPSTSLTFDQGWITGSRVEGPGYVDSITANTTDTIATYLLSPVSSGM